MVFRNPQTRMSTVYLGLGSNEGNRRGHLRAAVKHLHAHDAVRRGSISPVYETEAHTRAPDEEQPPFLNAVLRVHVGCEPESLLRLAHAVEQAEGRTRTAERAWQPRPLDVDLLVVGTETRQTDALTLPHPRLAERRFVLRPWADLAPNFVVPAPFDQSVQSLLDQCTDPTDIRRIAHARSNRLRARSPVNDDSS
jgi:2-amino-4-hydroxy-6-hydroxymethyldihydropteridine diphosphokinase